MEAGRIENQDIQAIRSLTGSAPMGSLQDIAGQKLTLLQQMVCGFETAIAEIKEDKFEEIDAILQEQSVLMSSVDVLDHDYRSLLNQLSNEQQTAIAKLVLSDTVNSTFPLIDLLHQHKKVLSRVADLHEQLTVLVRDNMAKAKDALVDIKNQKDLRGIRQSMEGPTYGNLMDRTIR